MRKASAGDAEEMPMESSSVVNLPDKMSGSPESWYHPLEHVKSASIETKRVDITLKSMDINQVYQRLHLFT